MTKKLDLADFDALTFDFYGTIVNWEPEILAFLRAWSRTAAGEIADDCLLEAYDRARQPIQSKRPIEQYPDVLKQTLDAMAAEFGFPLTEDLRKSFGGIAATHQAFPDSLAALRELRSRGLLLGALSNIDDESFATILGRLGFAFDFQVTAQRVGAYKPDMAHFLTALSDLRARGIEKERVLHVAQSKRADLVPANALGLTCVWIDRPGHVFGRAGGGAETVQANYTVSSLAELLQF